MLLMLFLKTWNKDVLNELIIIYKNTFLERYYSIHSSLKKIKYLKINPMTVYLLQVCIYAQCNILYKLINFFIFYFM